MGKSQEAEVIEFTMTLHQGVCWAPEDGDISLNRLYYGEKQFWEGTVNTPGQALDIHLPNFMGGPTKEGGLDGYVYVLLGDEDQLMPVVIAEKFGLSTTTIPGFRGALTLFFTGAKPAEFTGGFGGTRRSILDPIVTWLTAGLNHVRNKGFSFAHNNPYMKPIWAEVTWIPRTLDTYTSEIVFSDSFGSNSVPTEITDANPAHIIYESYINEEWGAGEPTSSLDTDSFLGAAQTLFDEGFGLSLGWYNQEFVEEFVADVLTHIQGVVFMHPRTGKITLKLLRDDYDAATLPIFDESNSKLTDVQRQLYGEQINEVQVKWTNPSTEKEEVITLQDLAGIFAQGNIVVSTTRNYPGIRNSTLATAVCARDLRTASSPLASGEITMDRSAWDLYPGDVIKVSNREECFNEVIFRIIDVDYGKAGESSIKCKIVEDIFAFNPGQYFQPVRTLWTSGATQPAAADHSFALSVPAFFARDEVTSDASFESPDTLCGVLVTSSARDTSTYVLATEFTDLAGETGYINLEGDRPILGRATLPTALVAEAETALYSFGTIVGPIEAFINAFVVIGEVDDAEQEWGFISGEDNTDSTLKTIRRGVLDTTPKAWPAGTPVWFVGQETTWVDPTVRAGGDTVNYKVLPITSIGTLSMADAPVTSVDAIERPLLPNRPANVKVNGHLFGLIADGNEIDIRDDSNSAGAALVTWANRNRILEETTVLAWDDLGITSEAGQTTNVRTYTPGDVLIAEHTGLAGEGPEALGAADFDGNPVVRIRVTSTRDGLESLQGHEIDVRVSDGGFDFDFDEAFSGAL